MSNANKMISMIFTVAPGIEPGDAARALSEAGVQVTDELGELGMFLGQALRSRLAPLRDLPEFSDVAEDETVDIGPPDATIQ
jgi:hypothetical protein